MQILSFTIHQLSHLIAILVGRVFIKENNILTDTFNFWSSGEKKDIINYINERDETKYKRGDFKSLDELFSKL